MKNLKIILFLILSLSACATKSEVNEVKDFKKIDIQNLTESDKLKLMRTRHEIRMLPQIDVGPLRKRLH